MPFCRQISIFARSSQSKVHNLLFVLPHIGRMELIMIKFIRFMLIFLIVLFALISVMIIVGAVVLYRYSSAHIDKTVTDAVSSYHETEFYCMDRSSYSFDKAESIKKVDNASLSNGFKHEYIPYNEIPKQLIDAFVSIEDKRFFEHNGIDHRRSAKAAANFILFQNSSFGGSTITQQLVKNLTGNNEKNIDRKLSEAFSAMDLERRYDKSEILEMYLNIINLAHGCRGIGAASSYYFSKSVKELSLSEAATITAITSNPSKFDPQKHPNENIKRRNIILKCMLEQGYITKTEYRKAIGEELILNIKEKKSEAVNSWYIDSVIEDVISDYSEKYGISKQNAAVLLYNGGYKIYTAMDEQLQQIIEDYFKNTDNFPMDNEGKQPISSMMIIDPNSGDILAIAGNIGEKKGNRIQNFATMTKRPPGSTIKPLSVYAPAIERGIINWSSIVEDSPITDKSNAPWPSNSNKKYLGDVNIKFAISNSLNTVAVKVLHMLGNEVSFDFLSNELGMHSLNKELDIGDASLALGQPVNGVTLKELTAAYTMLQNGIMCDPRTYYKVTDSSGRIILDNQSTQRKVISEETATIITKLLQNVITDGTARGYIDLSDIEVAGKTGTTQYSHDKYFIGYTPELLAGVWQGYEYPKTIDCFDGNHSICIWNDIFNLIYKNTDYADTDKKEFFVSKNVKKLSYNKIDGSTPNEFDERSEIEDGWFKVKND